jgi:FtsH-binding integral membrane protein
MIVAQLVSLPLLTADWRKHLRSSLAMALAPALLFAPIVALQLHDGLSQIDWIPRQESIVTLGRLVVEFAGSIALAIVMILCCMSLPFFERSREQRNHIWVLAIWFGVPLCLGLAISLYHPVFLPRYFASTFPAFVILVASGVRSIRFRAVSVLAAMLIVALSVSTLWSGRDVSSQDIRGAASFIAQRATPDDAVAIFQPEAIFAFREELVHRREILLAPIVYPLVEARSWSRDLRDVDPSTFPLGHYDHIWFVASGLDRTQYTGLMARLTKEYVETNDQQLRDVAVLRFEPKR